MASKHKRERHRRKHKKSTKKVWVEKTSGKETVGRKIKLKRDFPDSDRNVVASSDSNVSSPSTLQSFHQRADGEGGKRDSGAGCQQLIGPKPCSSRGSPLENRRKRKRKWIDDDAEHVGASQFDRSSGRPPRSEGSYGPQNEARRRTCEEPSPAKRRRTWKVLPPENFRGFAGKDDVLSNFYPCRLFVYGRMFGSTEHAYQWSKALCMSNERAATAILKASHAGKAKRIANQHFRHVDLTPWIPWRIPVLRRLLRAKARCCPEFRDELRNTGDRYLAEVVPGEKFWGIGDGTGQNVMGKLLMELRSTLDDALAADPNEDGQMFDFTQYSELS